MLKSGTRLGPYEVVDSIGSGGMGEVYRGRDTRLDRSVAIKILPTELAGNAQLRLRFEREAKTISNLEHPHICRLYDVGEASVESAGDAKREPSAGGASSDLASRPSPLVSYLVMELLDGESLADRLTRGPLPLTEVLTCGTQIAGALAKAHGEDIVHRDLKPGNIMLTRSGAKLLDFGLARSIAAAQPTPLDVTVQKPLTAEGSIVGTVQYMAPEQLAGEEPDARTDIFSLGAVLYEMATGRRAFEGKTRTSLIGAIVSGEPKPMNELRPLTPPALEHVVKRCLAKERDDRWQSTSDIAAELRWIAEAGSQAGMAAPVISRRRRREGLAWGVAVLALVVAAAFGWRAWSAGSQTRTPLRYNINVAPRPLDNGVIDVAPDGTVVWTEDTWSGSGGLFVREPDAFEAALLPDTAKAVQPAFSPDGEWIAFFVNGSIRKVGARGGAPVTLCSGCVKLPMGIAWGGDGNLYFADRAGGIQKVSTAGGKPAVVSKPDSSRDEISHRWPRRLDAQHLLVTVKAGAMATFDDGEIAALDTRDGKLTRVLSGGCMGTLLPAGHLAYVHGGTLYAIPFDAKTLRTTGASNTLVEHVAYDPPSGKAIFGFSDDALVYAEEHWTPSARIVSIDAAGSRQVVSEQPYYLEAAKLAPDGKTAAVVRRAANDYIGILDLARGSMIRLSFEHGNSFSPVWTPDGRRVIYWSENTASNTTDLMWRVADGSAPAERLLQSALPAAPGSVSPDGRTLAFVQATPDHQADIELLSLADRRVTTFLSSRFDEVEPRFSPDGRWLAYASNESGSYEVYVQSTTPNGGRWHVSTNGGRMPAWSPDGRALYYELGGALYRVPLRRGGAKFGFGDPEKLMAHFDAGTEYGFGITKEYNVTADGSFVVLEGENPPVTTQLNVIRGWQRTLMKRDPAPR